MFVPDNLSMIVAEKVDIKSVYDLYSYLTSISAIFDSPEDLTVYWSYRSSVYRVQWQKRTINMLNLNEQCAMF